MRYFLLEENNKIAQRPCIMNWHDKIDVRDIHPESAYKLPARELVFIQSNPDTLFTDIKMDKEEDSRSFQDIRMTDMQVVNQILDKYHGKAFCDNSPVQTGIPVVQYKETDWQFLKRMAGYMGLGVFCDGVTELPRIRLGLPETGRKVSFDADSYKCRMDETYYQGV